MSPNVNRLNHHADLPMKAIRSKLDATLRQMTAVERRPCVSNEGEDDGRPVSILRRPFFHHGTAIPRQYRHYI